jgi:(2R)-3-sulfolactate dehydrogenase (NADP+)
VIGARASEVEAWVAELLALAGLPAHHATTTAKAIVMADRWGIGSHGTFRLPWYLERLAQGGIRGDATMREVASRTALATFDGEAGMGHWQVWRAAERARDLALSHGVGLVAVGNSNHCGALGVYTLPIAEAGLVGLIFSNGPAAMPAIGGRHAILSTSPIAGTVATADVAALIDMSTSAVARGRIAQAAQRGEALQTSWAFDEHGQPTTDAGAALKGMLAPLGGDKGFALALLVEGLTGGMIGPALSLDVVDMFDLSMADRPQGISHLVVAIDPAVADVDGDRGSRMNALRARIEEEGGRLPGSRRLSAAREDGRVEIGRATINALGGWVRTHSAHISGSLEGWLATPSGDRDA